MLICGVMRCAKFFGGGCRLYCTSKRSQCTSSYVQWANNSKNLIFRITSTAVKARALRRHPSSFTMKDCLIASSICTTCHNIICGINYPGTSLRLWIGTDTPYWHISCPHSSMCLINAQLSSIPTVYIMLCLHVALLDGWQKWILLC